MVEYRGYSMPVPVMPKERWDSVGQYLEYLRFLAAYVFAKEFVDNKSILEIGCGYGYGADYLAKSVSSIVSIDVSREFISYCKDKYSEVGIAFLQADGTRLPFRDRSFDAVLSLQVIEHIEPKVVLDYLCEIRRVLEENGIFIFSTPNRKLRLLPFQRPWNPEHKREYDDRKLRKLLCKVFKEFKIYGLCDSNEIQSFEKKRVRQNPLKVYIIAPSCKLIERLLPSWLVFQAKRLTKGFLKFRNYKTPILRETFLEGFSTDDFRINPTCPEDCLDFYGICKKVED